MDEQHKNLILRDPYLCEGTCIIEKSMSRTY